MKPTYKTKSNLYRKVSGKKGLSNSLSYQRGGTLPPIYTSNRNNPRLQRYNDSLNLYNRGERNYQTRLAFNRANNIPTSSIRTWNDPIAYDGDSPARIQPIQGNGYFFNHSPDVVARTNIPSSSVDNYGFRYKKPVQPVLYADPKIVEKQKKLKEAGLYTGELDGIWGKNSKEAWKKYEEGLAAGKTTTTTTAPTTATTTTSTTPTTSATTTTAVKPPVVTKPAIYTAPTPVQKKTTPQSNTDTPWRFMLGNDSYQTFDEETAKMFAKDLGITNLQRGDNKNIDPATKKYRDYSSLVTPGTTGTGTTGTITKYPKLKRMEYGGQIAKGSRLKKLYTAYKTRQ